MRLTAVLEIPDAVQVPPAIFRAAYEASRHGPVVMLATRSIRREIDRHLDAVVASDMAVYGVEYRDTSDPTVWDAVSPSTVVVVTSSELRRKAASAGAECLEVPDAASALADLPSLRRIAA